MRASNNALKTRGNDLVHRLREVIERSSLHSEELLDESSLHAPGYEELIACLTREIDETVLPRRFGLFSDGRMVAHLTVSNRRLLELEIEEQRIRTEAGQDASPERVANAYAQALRALCTRSGPLDLRMIGRARHALADSEACSARHLSDFGEVPYFKNRLKAFLKEIHSATHGWIFRTGESEAVAHDPDSMVFKHLSALEQKVRAEFEARNGFRHLGRNGPNLAAFSMSAELQAIVVTDSRDLLVAALPASEVSDAMTQWNCVYGAKRLAD